MVILDLEDLPLSADNICSKCFHDLYQGDPQFKITMFYIFWKKMYPFIDYLDGSVCVSHGVSFTNWPNSCYPLIGYDYTDWLDIVPAIREIMCRKKKKKFIQVNLVKKKKKKNETKK